MAGDELVLQDERLIAGDTASDTDSDDSARGTNWWSEIQGIFWLVVAVLGFHSLVAKPFYIPSESMMPGLLVGDRLVVTKYPYGYSFVTPTFHLLPFMHGRVLGRMPERGDVVIVTPPGSSTDYIKRVIGLPGDRVAVKDGLLYLNGVAVPRTYEGVRNFRVEPNLQCDPVHYPGRIAPGPDNTNWCRLPIYRETLPNGRSYDTIDLGTDVSPGDNYAERRVAKGHVFLMGDNRDNSADSRYTLAQQGLGGPVPWENIGGRAEFITFSLDGSAGWNPLTWPASFRGDRAGLSLHPSQATQGDESK